MTMTRLFRPWASVRTPRTGSRASTRAKRTGSAIVAMSCAESAPVIGSARRAAALGGRTKRPDPRGPRAERLEEIGAGRELGGSWPDGGIELSGDDGREDGGSAARFDEEGGGSAARFDEE